MHVPRIKRANDALEELLRHHSEAVELDPLGVSLASQHVTENHLKILLSSKPFQLPGTVAFA